MKFDLHQIAIGLSFGAIIGVVVIHHLWLFPKPVDAPETVDA